MPRPALTWRSKIKIYTGTGDRGRTSLFSGERVEKNHDRVEAYGDVDELGSFLGALVTVLPKESSDLADEIHGIQSDLLHVGAWLATMPGSSALQDLAEISEARVHSLETAIDRMEQELPVLNGFILPGGHPSAAWAHVARTVCRRAERHVVRLSRDMDGSRGYEGALGRVIMYLNRLSDYLFVLARHCNRITGLPDLVWEK